MADYDQDEEGERINPLQGRRIFVLSLQGETLQVYTHPGEGQTGFTFPSEPGDTSFAAPCCFDGKLLAPVLDRPHYAEFVGVVALFGV